MVPPFPWHQGIPTSPGTSGAAQGLSSILEAGHTPGPKGSEASNEMRWSVPGGPDGGPGGTGGPPLAAVRSASRPTSGPVLREESDEHKAILLNGLSILDSLAEDPLIQQKMLAKVVPAPSNLLW